jgi:hypothetical protein
MTTSGIHITYTDLWYDEAQPNGERTGAGGQSQDLLVHQRTQRETGAWTPSPQHENKTVRGYS